MEVPQAFTNVCARAAAGSRRQASPTMILVTCARIESRSYSGLTESEPPVESPQEPRLDARTGRRELGTRSEDRRTLSDSAEHGRAVRSALHQRRGLRKA